MSINKWLYEKRGIYREIYMYLSFIRQIFYTFTNQRKKSIRIIHEHFKWRD